MILVTGGAGFIGTNFVLDSLAGNGSPVVNLDKLTYAGNLENLASLEGDPRHVFVRGDVCDRELVDRLLAERRPSAVVHFAAESHVDRSIHGPGEFVRTNVQGTFTLLEAVRAYWGAPAIAGVDGVAPPEIIAGAQVSRFVKGPPARIDVLERLGHNADAREAYLRAAALSDSPVQQQLLRARAAKLRG